MENRHISYQPVTAIAEISIAGLLIHEETFILAERTLLALIRLRWLQAKLYMQANRKIWRQNLT